MPVMAFSLLNCSRICSNVYSFQYICIRICTLYLYICFLVKHQRMIKPIKFSIKINQSIERERRWFLKAFHISLNSMTNVRNISEKYEIFF